jgi:DNA mismatch repair protein MutL
MPIRRLPQLLVNQIAAGEVIERPASVVKELIENSLDAGARRIDVAIEEGGCQLIRVSDDGCGIPESELTLALAPHATSKLHSADDLAAIRTLGFRGEALASIASVSRLRLVSRATSAGRPADAGYGLQATGDQLTDPAPIATSPGTVIEIRDLFFNTPARRKFLRSPQTEFGHISELLGRVAMVHPRVSFTLSHQGRKVLDLAPHDSRAARCLQILGKELAEGLLEFEQQDPPDRGSARLWGLAGTPTIARSSSKFQYLCLNGRPIKDRNLTHALKEAYRGLLPPDRQPVLVLFIEIDPAQVDVNVHPTKAEVRFRNASYMHGLVLATIRQRLLGTDLTATASLLRSQINLDRADPVDSASSQDPLAATSRPLSSNEFVDYFRAMDPKEKGFVYQQVREAFAQQSPGQTPLLDDPANPDHASPTLKPQSVLQIHKSYLVTEDEHGLLIVDQHALHERVMFEQLRQRVLGQNQPLESQRLLMPAVLQASSRRQAVLHDLKPLLTRIGVEVEPIGPDALAVHAFPTFLFDRKVDPAEFLNDLLDRAENDELAASPPLTSDSTSAVLHEAVLHKVLDMMACKAAVKAGDHMTESELSALLAQREQIERASNCPHGRPTSLRLSLRDLEKQFKRV